MQKTSTTFSEYVEFVRADPPASDAKETPILLDFMAILAFYFKTQDADAQEGDRAAAFANLPSLTLVSTETINATRLQKEPAEADEIVHTIAEILLASMDLADPYADALMHSLSPGIRSALANAGQQDFKAEFLMTIVDAAGSGAPTLGNLECTVSGAVKTAGTAPPRKPQKSLSLEIDGSWEAYALNMAKAGNARDFIADLKKSGSMENLKESKLLRVFKIPATS